MATKLYKLSVHLVVPLTVNHKTTYFSQAFKLDIFENVRPLYELIALCGSSGTYSRECVTVAFGRENWKASAENKWKGVIRFTP